MTNILVVVLTLAYVLVAYVGPLAVFVFSGFWAWNVWSGDSGFAAAAAVFILNTIVLLLVLSFAKRMLKKLMNMVDLGEDDDLETAKD